MAKKACGNRKKGNTLVELMAVLVIMAILASAAAGIFRGYVDRAKNAEAYEKAHMIIQALEIVEAERSEDGGFGAEILTDIEFFQAPNNPSSVLYPYVGEETEDCTGYYIRFRRQENKKYQISGFTYETDEYTLKWNRSSGIEVERKQAAWR